MMIDVADLDDIAVGGAILGTGGGGDPYIGKLMAQQAIRKYGAVRMIDVAEIRDDDLVVPCAMMGAPTVMVEKIPQGDEILTAFRKLERFLGKKIGAILCAEAGGLNSTIPFVIGAMTGIPVIDGDGMGRAFPEAQMQSFAIADLKMYPHVVADVRDNEVIVARAATWQSLERVRRKVCTEFGSVATTCQAPRTGAEIKRHAVLHTTSRAIALGREVRCARAAHEDTVAAILREASGKLLFLGKVIDVQRRTTEGFLRGTTRFAGLDGDAGSIFEIAFQNEFTVGWREGSVAVTTPDLICVLDSVSGEAIGTESLRYGQRVSVVALPSPQIHRTAKGLQHVGPRAFGYDIPFKSVFVEEKAEFVA